MAEMKGGVFMTFIFLILVLPTFIMFSMNTLHNNYYMKITTEFTDVIKNEGGLTSYALNVKNNIEKDRGYSKMEIQVTDSQGNEVIGQVPYGDTLLIKYEYTYKSVKPATIGKEGTKNVVYPVLKSTDRVIVTKR